jgi:MFS family permease
LAAGTVVLLLALSWAGSTYAWFSFQILGTLLLALVSYVLFLRVESRAAEPIMCASYFRNGIFAVSVIATFLLSAGMFSNLQYTPLFVQGVIGASATSSGAVMTAHMIAFMVSNVVTGQLLSRMGRYKLLATGAFVLALAGTLLFAVMNIHTTTAQVTRNMVLTGLGIGMGSLFVIVVQNAFPHSELGQVTATLQFFRSIGGTMGTALLGTVLTNSFQSAFQSNLTLSLRNALPPERLGEFQNPQVLLTPAASLQLQQNLGALGPQGERLFEQMVPVLRASLSDAITSVFTVCTILMLLGLVATFFLREIPLRSTFDSSQVPPGREEPQG